MKERIKLALAIVRGRADIVHLQERLPLHGDPSYGYFVSPSYDHTHDFLEGNVGEDVLTRTVHIYEGRG